MANPALNWRMIIVEKLICICNKNETGLDTRAAGVQSSLEPERPQCLPDDIISTVQAEIVIRVYN